MTARVTSWRTLAGATVATAALGVAGTVVPAVAASAAPVARSAATAAAPAHVSTVRTTPVLARGSTGAPVKYVQRLLGVKATGVFGARTYRAVRAFQKSVKLRVTGIVDARTWTALKRRAAAAASRARVVSVATSDPTVSATLAASRTARNAVPFALWATSAHGRAIVKRESGGRCAVVSSNGLYRGKWQMSVGFWKTYGGTAFAAAPNLATCAQQDQVAYRGWLAAWWRPWGG